METKEITIHANVTYKYTPQDIDNMMATALEDGICGWCRKAVAIGKQLGEYASDQISRGGSLMLYDAESNDKWELTPEKFKNGVTLWAKENGYETPLGEVDAEAADCIIQYALFGELVFG